MSARLSRSSPSRARRTRSSNSEISPSRSGSGSRDATLPSRPARRASAARAASRPSAARSRRARSSRSRRPAKIPPSCVPRENFLREILRASRGRSRPPTFATRAIRSAPLNPVPAPTRQETTPPRRRRQRWSVPGHCTVVAPRWRKAATVALYDGVSHPSSRGPRRQPLPRRAHALPRSAW